MSKEISQLDQVLIDTIKKATAMTGDVIDSTKKVTGQAIDFASAQIPDVVHQLLLWKLTEAIVISIACIIPIILFFIMLAKVKRLCKELNEDVVGPLILYILFGGIILIILPTISLIENILEAIKITVAPKLYLIEYVANLLK